MTAEDIARHIKQGQYREALHCLGSLDTDRDAYLGLLQGKALVGLERISDAIPVFLRSARAGGLTAGKAWLSAGICLRETGLDQQATDAFIRCLMHDPENGHARLDLCRLLYLAEKYRASLPHARWLLDKSPSINAALVFSELKMWDKALAAFIPLLKSDPHDPLLLSSSLKAAQQCCSWKILEHCTRSLSDNFYHKSGFDEPREAHLVHIAWCMHEKWNLEVARARARKWDAPNYTHQDQKFFRPLRVGYVSGDFRNHATLHLMAGIFERHDPQKVEVFAYCYSEPDSSWFRQHFEQTVPNLVIIRDLTDDEAAARIKQDKIDILVDRKGFTKGHRQGIFARRPAPIQATWLGYPGTSGADWFDYIISDPVVTPDGVQEYYSEHLCRLPETYQCNDQDRFIASNGPSRKDCGLPEDRIVFCCFNNTYKLEPVRFKTFMAVLKDVPGSVLWLLDPGEQARKNLGHYAKQLGVEPERMIFAPRVPAPVHLARTALADLALDTRIYTGHTTTSDALWAGTPVVATKGGHFASRVSESLLRACNMPELVTEDEQGFYKLAVDLALNPDKLAGIREKLAREKLRAPLFDTQRFTRHMEKAFSMMVERDKPGAFDVPALPPRQENFAQAVPTRRVEIQEPESGKQTELPDQEWLYPFCPLCSHDAPETKEIWLTCPGCGHVYRKYHHLNTPGALKSSLLDKNLARQVMESLPELAGKTWLDVYSAKGELGACAKKAGFRIKTNKKAFLSSKDSGGYTVIALQGLLETAAYPDLYIHRARALLQENGALIVSYSQESTDTSRLHQFTPQRLRELLKQCGFSCQAEGPGWISGVREDAPQIDSPIQTQSEVAKLSTSPLNEESARQVVRFGQEISRENSEEVIRQCEEVLEENPGNNAAFYLLTQAVTKLGRLAQGDYIKPLDQALEEKGWQHKRALYHYWFDRVEYKDNVHSPELSVIVLSHRYHPFTLENLQRLRAQCRNIGEIIFVNNGCRDSDFASFEPYVHTWVRLRKNSGACIGRNLGATFCTAPILLFIDDDGFPEDNLVQAHLGTYRFHDVIAVRGVYLPKTDTPVPWHYFLGTQRRPSPMNMEGNASFKTQLFCKAGGFSDHILVFAEGEELSYRLSRLEPDKGKQVYTPEAVLRHDYVRSEEVNSKKKAQRNDSYKLRDACNPEIRQVIRTWPRKFSNAVVKV